MVPSVFFQKANTPDHSRSKCTCLITHESKHKIKREARKHDRNTDFRAEKSLTWTYFFNTTWRTSSAPTNLVSLYEHATCLHRVNTCRFLESYLQLFVTLNLSKNSSQRSKGGPVRVFRSFWCSQPVASKELSLHRLWPCRLLRRRVRNPRDPTTVAGMVNLTESQRTRDSSRMLKGDSFQNPMGQAKARLEGPF